MTLVVDASVGLKWVLQEADSPLAERLIAGTVSRSGVCSGNGITLQLVVTEVDA